MAPIITTTKKMRPRQQFDHYPTPAGVVRAALDLLPVSFTPRRVLDNSAGTGVWLAVAKERWLQSYRVGVEIQYAPRPACVDEWHQMDFANYTVRACVRRNPLFDLTLMNPPYKWAEFFVRLSLLLTRPGGYVIALLRQDFLEGQERGRAFWRDYGPISVDTLSRRPSFTRKLIGYTPDGQELWGPDGKTDASAYAVFIWQKGNYPCRYSGGWLDWSYGLPILEEGKFKPFALLPCLDSSSLALPSVAVASLESLGASQHTHAGKSLPVTSEGHLMEQRLLLLD